MKLTVEKARKMLEESRGKTPDDHWINHSICVGDSAGKIAEKLNLDVDYANICLTHSYLNNDVYCTAGGIPRDIPFRTEFIKNHKYTIYEKIINLCDLMCTDINMTVDKRLIDIMSRRGAYENSQYHIKETYKLKQYIDKQLGFNVYDLFPSIKDNL